MKRSLLGVAMVLIGQTASAAEDQAILSFVADTLAPVLGSAAVQAAVANSNDLHAFMPENDLVSLDLAWRAEVGRAVAPTISPILESTVAQDLRNLTEQHAGTITEIILMDNRGMNVAISHLTSDFWQGDEEKYLMTFPLGARATHLSEIEFDESTQVYQLQASFTVTDTASGLPIGAVTVGLNAEAF